MSELAAPVALADCAIVVREGDDVAVVKRALAAGTVVEMPDGTRIAVTGEVTPGHRFATRDLGAGELVRQYLQPIGTSRGIGIGDPVTAENMSNEVPVVRELPDDLANAAPEPLAAEFAGTFQGFRRPDGRTGTRNWVVVVPTSMCAAHEAQQIAIAGEYTLWNRERYPNVDGVVALTHNKGCGSPDGSNVDVLMRTFANYADHPNVGGVLFIDLGCEKTNLDLFGQYLDQRGGLSWAKPTARIGIQESGGTGAAIERGLAELTAMFEAANRFEREEVPASELVLGVKCGGSDGFSGLSANPALGACADRVVRAGGTVLITEVPEFCGAEHVLAHRARNAEVGREVYGLVDWFKEYAGVFGSAPDENPSPGNKAGGLLNITIKSLGAIAKAGTTRVEGTTDYAVPPKGRGLHLMQGPGYDQESTPGLVGAGANVVVFTTGRGTTIGNAIAPVLKLASNSAIFERMRDDLDLDAGTIIDGTETIDGVGARVFEHVKRCASGELPAHAERHKHPRVPGVGGARRIAVTPHVQFTPHLLRSFPALEEGHVSGATVAEVLSALDREHPGVRGFLVDDQGALPAARGGVRQRAAGGGPAGPGRPRGGR